jgi:ELWxxDGT repeat protein
MSHKEGNLMTDVHRGRLTTRSRFFLSLAVLALCVPIVAKPTLVPYPDRWRPLPTGSKPHAFASVGGLTVFLANDVLHGEEPWVTDGTAEGTRLLMDCQPGAGSSSATAFTPIRGALYFTAAGKIWSTDGSAAGTFVIGALPVGQWISITSVTFHDAGSTIFIVLNGNQIWQTTGAEGSLVRMDGPAVGVGSPVGQGGRLFFLSDGLPWVTDGSVYGTHAIHPQFLCLNGCGGYYGDEAPSIFRLGASIYFTVTDLSTKLVALWRTDGTTAGTTLITRETGAFFAAGSGIAYLRKGSDLWRTDGTPSGTVKLATLDIQPTGPTRAIGNRLYFVTDLNNFSLQSLWSIDGASGATTNLAKFTSSVFTTLGSRVLFAANRVDHGIELWSSDGTPGGTAELVDLRPGALFDQFGQPGYTAASGSPSDFSAAANGVIYFSADDGIAGAELWRTDGTSSGTVMLKNIAPDVVTGSISGMLVDAVSAAPVAGGTVIISESGRGQVAVVPVTPDGTYRVDLLTPGTYYARAMESSHLQLVWDNVLCPPCTSTPINVVAGFSTAGVDFRLPPAASISGQVMRADPSGPALLPNAFALLDIMDSDHQFLTNGVVSIDKPYVFPFGLPPGTYYASIRPYNVDLVSQAYAGKECPDDAYAQCVNGATPIVLSGTTPHTGVDFSLHRRASFRGRVTDTLSGMPVSNIAIGFYRGTSQQGTATTDADGQYWSTPMVAGIYTIETNASSAYPAQLYGGTCSTTCDPSAGAPVVLNQDVDITTVDLTLKGAGGRISVVIGNARTGSPSAGVPVQLYDSFGYYVTSVLGQGLVTNDQGRVDLFPLPTGTYYLSAQGILYDALPCPQQGCSPTSGKPISVVDGQVTSIHMRGDASIRLSGRIVTAAHNSPVPFGGVQLSGAVTGFANADQHGYWSMRITATTGRFTIRASGADLAIVYYPAQPWSCSGTSFPSPCPPPPAGTQEFDAAALSGDVANLNFALPAPGRITGTVTDPLIGSVSVGTVEAFDGVYRFSGPVYGGSYSLGVLAGTYSVTFSAPGYSTQVYNGAVAVAAGGTTGGVDFHGASTNPLIRGRVLDARTGLPIPEALIGVSTQRGDATARSDAQGNYFLHSTQVLLDAGVHYVNVSIPGYYPTAYGGVLCLNADLTCPHGDPITLQDSVTTTGIDFLMVRPEVTSILPARGSIKGETLVTVTGTNFLSAPIVTVGNSRADVVSWSSTQVIFRTPPGVLGPVTLDLTFGRATRLLDGAFTYVLASSRSDYNGDSRSDLFWRNQVTGDNALWYLSAFSNENRPLPAVVDTTWKVQAVGDFNGDGMADVFWRNSLTGGNALWLMSGPLRTNVDLPLVADLGWQVQGSGDFDGDGKADLFWRNVNTGGNAIWLATGSSFTNVAMPTVADTGWRVAVVADVTGDGKADIVWRNPAILGTAMWAMNGTTYTNASLNQVSADWTIAGAADVNGDGIADLFWHNAGSGGNAVWLMGAAVSNVSLPSTPATWVPLAVGDFTGAGHPNVFWRDANSNQTQLWTVNSPTDVLSIPFPYVWRDWQPTGGR